jgi:hypothetical protein
MLILTASIATIWTSAETEEPLRELPAMMLREDFDRLVRQKFEEYEVGGETHDALRVRAFYEIQCLSENLSPRGREAMLAMYPIVELADIVVLDITITPEEHDWLIDQFHSIGFTQNDLIECYERMYELAEKSNSENKGKILSALPPIPDLTASERDVLNPAETEKELREIPVVLLEEDFERLIWKRMNETEGLRGTKKPERLKSYYEFYFYEIRNEKWQQALLKGQPYLELADICVLDNTLTELEKEFILEQLRLIGFTQNDLIECYERVYKLAMECDLENKEEILASLPEIPRLSENKE